ncbi:hypothetical protein [Flavobacterium sp. UGB4466]|uniref:hypothetical protein n=1 Tax=Flavobacterium sp. UGB4466 TaxID=2730889 RepID=UPI00192A9099|nr:hypothetical protein [Flavobacterium sp. UGB4466]
MNSNLVIHNDEDRDKDDFPINGKGVHIHLNDGQGYVFIPLYSNFFINVPEKAGIKFDPKNKLEVNAAVDTLINILANGFYDKLETIYTIDLTDECKRANKIRTNGPAKFLVIEMYFDWINKWLNYLGNVFNFEFKLLVYAKYKEKIKNDLLFLETGLKEINAPIGHVKFARKWLKETDSNMNSEGKARSSKNDYREAGRLQSNIDLKVRSHLKEEDSKQIRNILIPLSGKWNRTLIMSEPDFERLVLYTTQIYETGKLPAGCERFPRTGTTVEFMRKTMHLVYLNINKKHKTSFISLLHLFKQLENTSPSTTSSKFSVYTGSYEADLKKMIEY